MPEGGSVTSRRLRFGIALLLPVVISGCDSVSAHVKSEALHARWQTRDSFQLQLGKPARARAGAADSFGNVYVAGNAEDENGDHHWIVRVLKAGSTTWQTADDVNSNASYGSLYAMIGSSAESIAIDPVRSEIYVVGHILDSNLMQRWIVRRSTDFGATWTTVDDFGSFADTVAYGVAIDAKGQVYVVGTMYGTFVWTVRKSLDGIHWSTVDSYMPSVANPATHAQSVAVDSAGSVYVAGMDYSDLARRGLLTVRKSTDEGATWNTVESYASSEGGYVTPSSFYVDPASGELIVLASQSDFNQSKMSWIARRSQDGGASWSTSVLLDEYWSVASALCKQQNGEFLVTGFTYPFRRSHYEWIALSCDLQSGACQESERVSSSATHSSSAEGCISSPAGTFVFGSDARNSGTWTVREL
jgi:hypothetical protein